MTDWRGGDGLPSHLPRVRCAGEPAATHPQAAVGAGSGCYTMVGLRSGGILRVEAGWGCGREPVLLCVLPGLSEPCNYCVSSMHLPRRAAPLQLSAAAGVLSAGWRGCTSLPPHPVLLEKAGAACLPRPPHGLHVCQRIHGGEPALLPPDLVPLPRSAVAGLSVSWASLPSCWNWGSAAQGAGVRGGDVPEHWDYSVPTGVPLAAAGSIPALEPPLSQTCTGTNEHGCCLPGDVGDCSCRRWAPCLRRGRGCGHSAPSRRVSA